MSKQDLNMWGREIRFSFEVTFSGATILCLQL